MSGKASQLISSSQTLLIVHQSLPAGKPNTMAASGQKGRACYGAPCLCLS
jgi:hypothetical protein